MAETRSGEVKMMGNPVDLVGPKLKPGDPAPDFACVKENMGLCTLADTPAKVRLFSVVPSLDTPVCNIQTHKFSKTFNDLGDSVAAFTVSMDLPFAMKRFCADAGITSLTNLSDAHDHSFGEHFGVLIRGLPIPLLARAIFVIDPKNTITYVEIVPNVSDEPDYDAALAAVKAASGK